MYHRFYVIENCIFIVYVEQYVSTYLTFDSLRK